MKLFTALCLIATSSATFIANGNFEQGQAVSTYATGIPITGWTQTGRVVRIRSGQEAWGSPIAISGEYITALHHYEGGSIAQTVTTAEQGWYKLVWSERKRSGYGGKNLKISVDGVTIEQHAVGKDQWEKQEQTFQATSGNSIVKFSSNDGTEGTVFLDAISIVAVPAPADFLNGNFEQGQAVSTYATAIPINSWSQTGDVVRIRSGQEAWGSPIAISGEYITALHSFGGGQISQTVSTVAGEWYSLSWSMRKRVGYAVKTLTVAANGVTLDQQVVSLDQWAQRSQPFQATSSSTTITFTSSTDGSNGSVFLDEISLTSSYNKCSSCMAAASCDVACQWLGLGHSNGNCASPFSTDPAHCCACHMPTITPTNSPTPIPGDGEVCEHTYCTYTEAAGEVFFRTKIHAFSNEDFKCGKTDTGCECKCQAGNQCTLEHHHDGSVKSFTHC